MPNFSVTENMYYGIDIGTVHLSMLNTGMI
jgi:hypothetical protein